MRRRVHLKLLSLYIAIGLPIVFTHTALAAGDVTSVESFIRSVITVMASLAGLVATGFIVVGGFSYITSSGNPEHLEKAKRTIMYSGMGLAITIAAFVISNIVTTLATNAFGK
ncbi:MAG TPA: pilin [Patescibacteria group bacterium]|nr:pilin [Patescibacteria group bacterium]